MHTKLIASLHMDIWKYSSSIGPISKMRLSTKHVRQLQMDLFSYFEIRNLKSPYMHYHDNYVFAHRCSWEYPIRWHCIHWEFGLDRHTVEPIPTEVFMCTLHSQGSEYEDGRWNKRISSVWIILIFPPQKIYAVENCFLLWFDIGKLKNVK